MTAPPRFTRPKARTYLIDGQRVPGVTTVIGVLDKPAPPAWAANTTAEYAINNWERLSGMSIANRLNELKGARYAKNKEATVRGKRIHELAERVMKGEAIADVPRELRAPVQAYADMLDAWGFEAIALEGPCANLGYRYAGTFDGLFTSPKTGPVIVDVKTGKKAYSEVALQLAAYRNADLFLVEEERRGPRDGRLPSEWVEKPMPQVNGALVIHVAMETDESPAKVNVMPVETGEEIFTQFLYALELYEGWVKRTGWDHRSEPSWSPPVGEPIYPEINPEDLQELIQS